METTPDPVEPVSSNPVAPGAAGGPVGRRLFLGMLGVGVAGLVGTRFALSSDDAAPGELATAIPLGPDGQPVQREPLEGNHPNILYSERFRYYSVGSIPDFNERTWRLTVDGEGADNRLSLRYAEVKAFTNVLYRADFHCVNGWRVRQNAWRGVRLRDVLNAARPNAKARFVTFYANDGVYTESLAWNGQQALSDRAWLVWELDGKPLIREQGYPLRLIFPDMYGYKNIKWLSRIEIKSGRDLGFWEASDGWEIDGYITGPDHTAGGGGSGPGR